MTPEAPTAGGADPAEVGEPVVAADGAGEPSADTTRPPEPPPAPSAPAPTGTPARPGPEEAGRPVAGARQALRAVGTVVAPATLIAALLYWFGESRVRAQSDALGVDHSVFGFSNQDYVTRSVSSMFRPIAVGLVVVLGWLLADWALSSWVRSPAGERTRRRRRQIVAGLVAVLAVAGVVVFLAGWLPESGASDPAVWQYPVRIGLGIALVGYAGDVWWRFVARRQPRPPGAANTSWVGPASGAVVAALVTLCLFWAVTDYANEVGHRLVAEWVAGGFEDRPDVVVYSERDLHLDHEDEEVPAATAEEGGAADPPQEGVTETQLPQTDGGYRFRYEGLKLLLFSDGKFFLVPKNWPGSEKRPEGFIILPDDSSIRLEFFR